MAEIAALNHENQVSGPSGYGNSELTLIGRCECGLEFGAPKQILPLWEFCLRDLSNLFGCGAVMILHSMFHISI